MAGLFLNVHIAGDFVDGLQHCSRCGSILVDVRGAAFIIGENDPCAWRPGAIVGQAGGAQVLLSHDAVEDDEVPCGRPQ
jgi:hypothetical protein